MGLRKVDMRFVNDTLEAAIVDEAMANENMAKGKLLVAHELFASANLRLERAIKMESEIKAAKN